MLTPIIDENLADAADEPAPSLGYTLDTDRGRVRGAVDEIKAVQQAVLMILATEQGQHAVYGADYGLKTADLIGKPYSYVTNELQRRIKEALLRDDRIKAVHSFSSRSDGDQLIMSFTIDCIFGSFSASKEVAT